MDEPARDGQRGREELLAKLSLKEKISLLTGADYWSLRGHSGIRLRPVRTSDGPAGVRGPRWDERDVALNVPAPVALAATWDPRRAELIGSLLAAECRRKDVELIRFDTAKDLLDAGHPVTDTALRSGYGSAETLRRAFISHLGISPRAYQQRFRSAIRN